jgi:hypothetical protein
VVEVNELAEAVSSQLRSRGIDVEEQPAHGSAGPDLLLKVPTAAGVRTMVVQLQISRGRPPEPGRTHENDRVMLADWFIPPRRAQALRSSGTPFVDSVGNMWLELPGFVVDVEGRPRPAERRSADTQGDRLSRPASLRVIFALLTSQELQQATLRDLAAACGTSLGATQATMADLTANKFVYASNGSHRELTRTGALADRWVSDFASRLLPKLRTISLRGPDPRWWFLRRTDLVGSAAALGGEAASELLGYPLRSTSTLIYGRPPWGTMRKLGRLAEEGQASVVLRERFWPGDGDGEALAPSLLVYADLISSGEQRQLETAMEMRQHDVDLRRLWS